VPTPTSPVLVCSRPACGTGPHPDRRIEMRTVFLRCGVTTGRLRIPRLRRHETMCGFPQRNLFITGLIRTS
jgi:hypothetical protein